MCDGCKRVYWQGSHFHRMKRFLLETLQLPESLGQLSAETRDSHYLK
jgi:uncharacterized protein with PIN domain